MVKQALSDSEVYVAVKYNRQNWDTALFMSIYSLGHK